MNLTQPPFDDIHVRRAVNFVVNREACAVPGAARPPAPSRRTSCRTPSSATSSTATRRTATATGDLDKAKAEMKQSKYDTNKDGICDAQSAARTSFTITGDRRSRTAWIPVLDAEPEARSASRSRRACSKDAYTPIQTAARTSRSRRGPVGARTTPTPDVLRPALRQPHIIPEGNTNYSLVGITPAIGQEGRRQGHHRPASRASTPTSTRAARSIGNARVSCYAALDKKLMEEVVPWVPYLWSLRPERHRARTSRSTSSTSSAGRSPTPTWRSK